mmetsp:Transcript_96644/g.256836  ORF Transcript_96644/g.256836 Transcript_96644/m.256836 type:complete len:204 (-) Transcript_96644:15-626(-)
MCKSSALALLRGARACHHRQRHTSDPEVLRRPVASHELLRTVDNQVGLKLPEPSYQEGQEAHLCGVIAHHVARPPIWHVQTLALLLQVCEGTPHSLEQPSVADTTERVEVGPRALDRLPMDLIIDEVHLPPMLHQLARQGQRRVQVADGLWEDKSGDGDTIRRMALERGVPVVLHLMALERGVRVVHHPTALRPDSPSARGAG